MHALTRHHCRQILRPKGKRRLPSQRPLPVVQLQRRAGDRHAVLVLLAGARAEAEFAFQLTAKPHLRQMPWTASEMETMMVLHPAIEIIGNRFKLEDAKKVENSLMTIADNGGGIGFIFGDPVEDWQGIDYQQHLIDQ